MSKRLAHSRQPGQSLPIIAAVIVVVVAMIGLGVDVGNTYAEQRATVRAADAAAVAAMSKMIINADDATIGSSITQSFTSNGVPVQMNDPNATPSNLRTVEA